MDNVGEMPGLCFSVSNLFRFNSSTMASDHSYYSGWINDFSTPTQRCGSGISE